MNEKISDWNRKEFFCQRDTDQEPGSCFEQCRMCMVDVMRANVSQDSSQFIAGSEPAYILDNCDMERCNGLA